MSAATAMMRVTTTVMADLQSSNPPAENALRALLRGDVSEWPQNADAEEFLRVATEHGIAPLLHAKSDRMRGWPARVCEALRVDALRAAAVEPFRLADLREVIDALPDALIVKGTALAYSLYAAPDLRPRGDTDLLVDDIASARAALLALGFSERLTSGDELAMRQAAFVRRDAHGLEHLYDVHWSIANTPLFADVLGVDELRARAVPLPRVSANAMTIGNVDALLYACVHRIAHHYDDQKLIWLSDIALLHHALSGEERARFWSLAADRGVIAVCIRSLDLAAAWFGSTRASAQEFLDSETLSRPEATAEFLAPQTRGDVLRRELRALGWRARAKRIRQLAFPPQAYMRAKFGGAAPWRYAVRAVRGVARLFRRAT